MMDCRVSRIPMTKLPCRNGVALERILAKANPAISEKRITRRVDATVKKRLFRNRVSN